MTITDQMREQVRQRANFACEYCGVTETDTGGQLTVDHFHPQSKGGNDNRQLAVLLRPLQPVQTGLLANKL